MKSIFKLTSLFISGLLILTGSAKGPIKSEINRDGIKEALVWESNKEENLLRILGTNGDVYGISGQKVYKLDSTGNTLWVRNFSQPVNPNSSDPNYLSHFTLNNDRLFILEMQSPAPGQWGDSYPAIIVLDTSGALINISCREVLLHGVRQKACFNASNGGVWCVYESGGNYSYVQLFRTDINGDPDTSTHVPFIQFYSTFFSKVINSMVDSTFVIFTNSIDYNGSPLQGTFSCVKMDNIGNVLWSYTYYDSSFVGIQYTYHYAATIDQSGDIYFGGEYYYSSHSNYISGPILVKLNSNGQVIDTKYWTQPQIKSYAFYKMQFMNDSIYTDIGLYTSYASSASMVFDTMFLSNCLAPDSNVILNAVPLGIFYGGPVGYNFPVNNFPMPDSGQFTIPISPQYPDFCIVLNVSETDKILHDSEINIYPNPAFTMLKISSAQFDNLIEEIDVYDSRGALSIRKQYSSSAETTLDLIGFHKGIYFLKIKTQRNCVYRKFLIQ